MCYTPNMEELTHEQKIAVSEAARLMGKRTTDRKKTAAAANLASLNESRKTAFSEDTKAKLRVSQAARRAREKAQRENN